MALGALGTLGVILSIFLPWRTGSGHPSDIPFAFLWDHTTTAQNPSLLIALIPLAIILVVGTVLPGGAGARIFGGLCVLVVAGLFAYQVSRVTDAFGGSVSDALDTGFYFAAIGGLIGLVSGFLPSGWAAHRTVERDSAVDDGRYVR
jgi:MFS superfamily sulfate permease-like transporter